jgi:hypothetical protein
MKFIETYLGNEYRAPQQGEFMTRTPRIIVMLKFASYPKIFFRVLAESHFSMAANAAEIPDELSWCSAD